MGFLPGLDVDLSSMTNEELEALRRHLELEHARSKSRQLHIEQLLDRVKKRLAP